MNKAEREQYEREVEARQYFGETTEDDEEYLSDYVDDYVDRYFEEKAEREYERGNE